MKKILLIILTLFSIASYSQVKQVYPQYGGTWKKLYLLDSGAFRLPIKIASTKDYNSSVPDSGQIYYDPIDSNVKVWTGTQWMNIGGSGGGTWGSITGTLSDQTDLQAALDLKLNLSDTSTMLSPYLNDVGYGLLRTGQLVYADTSTNALKLATQGDIDRAIAANPLSRFGVSGEDATPAQNRSVDFTSTYTMGLRHMSSLYADTDSSLSSIGYTLFQMNKSSNMTRLGTLYRNLTTNQGASLYESNWNLGNPYAQLVSWKDGSSTTANYFRTYTDSLSSWLTSGSKYKIHNLPSGVGTKSIRYNPSNGEITYADTTTGGSTSLSDVGGGLAIQTGGAGNIRTLNTGEFAVNTNLISINSIAQSKITNLVSDLAAKEASFTETTQEFTSSTSMSITLSNTPKAGKAEMYYLNGVVIQISNVSRTGTGVTLSGFTREASDIITAKYSY